MKIIIYSNANKDLFSNFVYWLHLITWIVSHKIHKIPDKFDKKMISLENTNLQ